MGIMKLCACAFYLSQLPFPFFPRGHETCHSGKDLAQPICCALGFWFTAVQAVFKVKERLSDWVRIRHTSRIDECDVSNAPALRVS